MIERQDAVGVLDSLLVVVAERDRVELVNPQLGGTVTAADADTIFIGTNIVSRFIGVRRQTARLCVAGVTNRCTFPTW